MGKKTPVLNLAKSAMNGFGYRTKNALLNPKRRERPKYYVESARRITAKSEIPKKSNWFIAT